MGPLGKRLQVLYGERGCPIAEREKADTKVGLELPDLIVLDLAVE